MCVPQNMLSDPGCEPQGAVWVSRERPATEGHLTSVQPWATESSEPPSLIYKRIRHTSPFPRITAKMK